MNIEQQRNRLKQQRSQQPKPLQVKTSKQIANNLSQNSIYTAAEHIALYLPVNGEADPTSLVLENSNPKRKFYLPVLSPTGNKHLHFYQWDENTQFIDNIYGIPEPSNTSIKRPATQLDIVIMPLLGFDARGNRLGMGGGYYDRTFAFKLSHQKTNGSLSKPLLIAYAYSFQECASLHAQPWDVPLDYCVTEDKIINF